MGRSGLAWDLFFMGSTDMDMANLLYPQQEAGAPEAPTAAPSQSQEPGFLDKLRSDPNMMKSMLMAGARLMQGVRPGENPMAAFGDAVMIGNATHEMLKENQRKAVLEEQEAQRRNALADAQIGQANANTDNLRQTTSQNAAKFPAEQQKLAEDVRRLRLAGDFEGARARIEAFKAEHQGEIFKSEQAVRQANINQSNAAAGASGAAAEASRANTRMNTIKADAASELYQQGQYGTVLYGTQKTGAGAAKDQLEGLKVTLKAAYPNASDQEVAQMALEVSSGKKGQQLETLKALIDYGDDAQRTWAQTQLYDMAKGKASQGPSPVSGTPKTPPPVGMAPGGVAPALPPLASRVVGQVYPTPKGPMKWTAAGWVQP